MERYSEGFSNHSSENLQQAVVVIELLCFLYFRSGDESTANAAHRALTQLKAVSKRCNHQNLLTHMVNKNVFYLLELACLHRVLRKWKKDPRVREFAASVKTSGKKACRAFNTDVFRELELKLHSSDEDLDLDGCMECTKRAALSIPPSFDLSKRLFDETSFAPSHLH